MPRKQFALLAMSLAMALSLCACISYMYMEIDLDNGEKIGVKIDIKDGESISFEDSALIVRRGSAVLLEGGFFTNGEFDACAAQMSGDESMEILRMRPSEEPAFYLFQYETSSGTACGFLEKIEGSELSSVLLCTQSMSLESAEALYQQLHFTLLN